MTWEGRGNRGHGDEVAGAHPHGLSPVASVRPHPRGVFASLLAFVLIASSLFH